MGSSWPSRRWRLVIVINMLMCAACATIAAFISTAPEPTLAQTTTAPEYAAIIITPNDINIPATQTRLFTATVTNNVGSIVVSATVTWSLAPGAGTLVSTGPLTALVQVGTNVGVKPYALSATNAITAGTASYSVTAGPLATIVIQPPVDTVVVGGTRSFTAAGYDAYNNRIPDLNAIWSVSPAAGSIATSAATTMTLRASTTPGLFANAIKASSDAVVGTADLVVQVGPPASVVVTPSIATVPISATQAFKARVFDKYGNLLNLSITWLVRGGTLESVGANNAVFKAGTTAGTFATGLIAANGQVQQVVPITIPADPAHSVQIVAHPRSIKMDGRDSSTLMASIVDAYGNPAGAGATIDFSIVHCAGTCQLAPLTGIANTLGQLATTLRSTYTSPTQPLQSQIGVSAQVQAGGLVSDGNITVTGSFTPFKQFLALTLRDTPYTNHTSCLAIPLAPPATITQQPDQLFNLYRIVATQSRYHVTVKDYATTGQVVLYRVDTDECATSSTLSVTPITAIPITSQNFQTTLDDTIFAPGTTYLLAVNTTGAPSDQPYTLSVEP